MCAALRNRIPQAAFERPCYLSQCWNPAQPTSRKEQRCLWQRVEVTGTMLGRFFLRSR